MINTDYCFLKNLPKAELHVHLEGTMEPELFLKIAERNRIAIPYSTVEQARQSYNFIGFDGFIRAYIFHAQVILTEQDFYDITWAYLEKMVHYGLKHVEFFFDVQIYRQQRITAGIIITGIHEALKAGKQKFGITGLLILSFMRDQTEREAFQALDEILPFKDQVIGVGLAATEKNNPPSRFVSVFKKAKKLGFHTTAHAGECVADNIRDVIDLLQVERIDHGVKAITDLTVLKKIRDQKIPLTVCPISNMRLGVYQSIQEHPLKQLVDSGIIVTINSDDPAFFGGNLYDNYLLAHEMGLSRADLINCARNSFTASFLGEAEKQTHLEEFDQFMTSQAEITK